MVRGTRESRETVTKEVIGLMEKEVCGVMMENFTHAWILCVFRLCLFALMWSTIIEPPWLFAFPSITSAEIQWNSLLLSAHTDRVKD